MGNTFVNFSRGNIDVAEAELLALCNISGFKQKEVLRLRTLFNTIAEASEIGGQKYLSREKFMELDCIVNNPLADRIALCFGYDENSDRLDFRSFLCSVASFNLPGSKEKKLKIAFRIQDFDDDGFISKADLSEYIHRMTGRTITDDEVASLVNEVFKECSSDSDQNAISLFDFQHIVARVDFQVRFQHIVNVFYIFLSAGSTFLKENSRIMSAPLWTQLIRNFLCVLRSLLGLKIVEEMFKPLSGFLFSPMTSLFPITEIVFNYNISLSEKLHINFSGNNSQNTILITALVAFTQFLAVLFNINAGIADIIRGIRLWSNSSKFKKWLLEVKKSTDKDSNLSKDDAALAYSVLAQNTAKQRSDGIVAVIIGIIEIIFSFAFLVLSLNSVRISIGSDMLKLVVDSLISMEIGLLFFLYLMWQSLVAARQRARYLTNLSSTVSLPLSTTPSGNESAVALYSLLEQVVESQALPLLSDGIALVSSLGGQCSATNAGQLAQYSEKIQSMHSPEVVWQAVIDFMTTLKSGGAAASQGAKGSPKRNKSNSKNSQEEKKPAEGAMITVDKNLLVRALRQQAGAYGGSKFLLDVVLFLLNVIAGYGYLMGILAYYYLWPSSSSPPPSWVQTICFHLPADDADWIGNFAGDLAWTIEPLLILSAPFFLRNNSTVSPKKKSKNKSK